MAKRFKGRGPWDTSEGTPGTFRTAFDDKVVLVSKGEVAQQSDRPGDVEPSAAAHPLTGRLRGPPGPGSRALKTAKRLEVLRGKHRPRTEKHCGCPPEAQAPDPRKVGRLTTGGVDSGWRGGTT